MLLIEEKEIPIRIELVPMRSYGDKPSSFLRKVPNGLLPAIEVNGKIITESQVIMELLDQWHPEEEGYKSMMPKANDRSGMEAYESLARLERELFSWWCTLTFRPESGDFGSGGIFNNPFRTSSQAPMSSSMKGFLACMKKVDNALLSTKGPWFFDKSDHPTMIDFIFVSHVERMLASVAFWKGLNLRDPKWEFHGLTAWLEAFEKREAYLAFKSDYFTHVMDIPPQYGPGFDGGFTTDREKFQKTILGKDGSWHLPLPFDDPLQPLYKGPPLPLSILQSMDISPDSNGTYESVDPLLMSIACRHVAAWKLADNGVNIARFASRGGPKGSKNPRKSFGAPLADPYAEPDIDVLPSVDLALRMICRAMLDEEDDMDTTSGLVFAIPKSHRDGVCSSLAYLRDRVGVPRDLPLAAARYLRAYLNKGIDILSLNM
jgi:glutathione S-transferase